MDNRAFSLRWRATGFPQWAARVHPVHRIPHVTTLITGIAVGIAALIGDAAETYDLTNIGTLLRSPSCASACSSCATRSGASSAVSRAVRVAVVVARHRGCVFIMQGLPRQAWERFGLWLAIGLRVYRTGTEQPDQVSLGPLRRNDSDRMNSAEAQISRQRAMAHDRIAVREHASTTSRISTSIFPQQARRHHRSLRIGKSSLAFDTIYAEGQRRYVESLSAYARQFLEQMEKPDVDLIDGLSPAIAIEQKTTGSNPRSTVGTVTEIYDYMRLLFANIGIRIVISADARSRRSRSSASWTW